MNEQKYRKIILSPLKLKWMLFSRLPSLWFWGIKVVRLDDVHSEVHIKHSFFNKNPFKSIYFSALMGASEFSTGILAQQAVMELGNFSMLVTGNKASFTKKAMGKIRFQCHQGSEVRALLESLNQGEMAKLTMFSEGHDESDDLVMKAEFEWSFKKR